MKSCGAIAMGTLSSEFPEKAVGRILRMKERVISNKKYPFIRKVLIARCIILEGKNHKVITFVLAAGTSQAANEFEYQCKSAIGVLSKALSSSVALTGGGITELHLAYFLRKKATLFQKHRKGIYGMKKHPKFIVL